VLSYIIRPYRGVTCRYPDNRFCCGYRPVEVDHSVEGAFSLRSEMPAPRQIAPFHKTP
jgi:hypothetical protein